MAPPMLENGNQKCMERPENGIGRRGLREWHLPSESSVSIVMVGHGGIVQSHVIGMVRDLAGAQAVGQRKIRVIVALVQSGGDCFGWIEIWKRHELLPAVHRQPILKLRDKDAVPGEETHIMDHERRSGRTGRGVFPDGITRDYVGVDKLPQTRQFHGTEIGNFLAMGGKVKQRCMCHGVSPDID